MLGNSHHAVVTHLLRCERSLDGVRTPLSPGSSAPAQSHCNAASLPVLLPHCRCLQVQNFLLLAFSIVCRQALLRGYRYWPRCMRWHQSDKDMDNSIGPWALCNSFNLITFFRMAAMAVLTYYSWVGYQSHPQDRKFPVYLTATLMVYLSCSISEFHFISGLHNSTLFQPAPNWLNCTVWSSVAWTLLHCVRVVAH